MFYIHYNDCYKIVNFRNYLEPTDPLPYINLTEEELGTKLENFDSSNYEVIPQDNKIKKIIEDVVEEIIEPVEEPVEEIKIRKIWIFGGSYADIDNRPEFVDQWGHQLGYPIHSLALGGTSTDYVYKKFNDVRDQIDQDDIVIVVLSSLDRRWFVRDDPANSPWIHLIKNPRYNKSYADAVKSYLLYLEHREIYQTYLINFFYNLHNLTIKKNLHTIIMKSFSFDRISFKEFPQFHVAKGCLYKVSENEFDLEFSKKYPALVKGNDIRTNHMIKSNHKILANKIIRNIKRKSPIDLNRGFIKGVLNKKSLNNVEFKNRELFDIN
jgi:hypothetical protein